MEARTDERFVDLFDRAWGAAKAVATVVVGPDQAERVAIDAFARVFERWHRVARASDPDGVVLARTAEVAVRLVKKEGTAPRRAVERPDPLVPPDHAPSTGDPLEDAGLRLALGSMPRAVAVAFVLHHLVHLPLPSVASATGTNTAKAGQRATRGMVFLRRQVGPDGHEVLRAA